MLLLSLLACSPYIIGGGLYVVTGNVSKGPPVTIGWVQVNNDSTGSGSPVNHLDEQWAIITTPLGGVDYLFVDAPYATAFSAGGVAKVYPFLNHLPWSLTVQPPTPRPLPIKMTRVAAAPGNFASGGFLAAVTRALPVGQEFRTTTVSVDLKHDPPRTPDAHPEAMMSSGAPRHWIEVTKDAVQPIGVTYGEAQSPGISPTEGTRSTITSALIVDSSSTAPALTNGWWDTTVSPEPSNYADWYKASVDLLQCPSLVTTCDELSLIQKAVDGSTHVGTWH